jgi:hypothetical protein
MWIGRWPADNRVAVLNGIPNNLTNQAPLLKEALKNMYGPIVAHVCHAHALRICLLRGRISTEIRSAYTKLSFSNRLGQDQLYHGVSGYQQTPSTTG